MLGAALMGILVATALALVRALRGPTIFDRLLAANSMAVSAMVPRPPMPEPIITPVRSRLSSCSGVQPASLTASSAAAMPYRMKSSTRRRSLADRVLSGSKLPSTSGPPPPRPSTRGASNAIWQA